MLLGCAWRSARSCVRPSKAAGFLAAARQQLLRAHRSSATSAPRSSATSAPRSSASMLGSPAAAPGGPACDDGAAHAAPPTPHAPPRHLRNSFLPGSGPLQRDLYLIVLNYTLPNLTAHLWHQAKMRICADGGANRLFDELPRMLGLPAAHALHAAYLPDIIKGDLDSLRPDVADYYTSQGVALLDLSDDQDSTDLTKCVRYVQQHLRQRQHAASSNGSSPSAGTTAAAAAAVDGAAAASSGGNGRDGGAETDTPRREGNSEPCIVVLGALGGRLDHTLANLNALYMHPDLEMVLAGDGNLVRLLPRGRCVVHPDPACEGPTCALVPLAGPVVASSSGLRWNLQGDEMHFRGLLSTSNVLDAPAVAVEASDQLLWITEFRDIPTGGLPAPASAGAAGHVAAPPGGASPPVG